MHREFPYLECTSTFFDMLYKEYEIDKTNRHHKWIAIIIGIIIAINLIKLWMSFK